MATRSGVEKISKSKATLPSSLKQEDLIRQGIKIRDEFFKSGNTQSPPKMILSIDDEELPMVSIIKTNSIKQLLNLE